MQRFQKARIAIVGAGLSGASTAHSLRSLGFSNVRVFERLKRSDVLGGGSSKRANSGLIVPPNVMRTFRRIGLADGVYRAGHRLQTFAQCDRLGKSVATFEPQNFLEIVPPVLSADRPGDTFVALQRSTLLSQLLQSTPNDALQFDREVMGIRQSERRDDAKSSKDKDKNKDASSSSGSGSGGSGSKSKATSTASTSSGAMEVCFAGGGSEEFDLVIAADGVDSATRRALFFAGDSGKADSDRKALPQLYVRGLCSRSKLSGQSEPPANANDTLSELLGNGVRFGCTPLGFSASAKDSLFWYATVPNNQTWMSAARDPSALAKALSELPAYAEAVVRGTAADALSVESVEFRRPDRDHFFHTPSRTALVGSAVAFAPPDLFQRAALSIESGVTLAHCLSRAGSASASDLKAAFELYRSLHAQRAGVVITNALAESANANEQSGLESRLLVMATAMMPKAQQTGLLRAMLKSDPIAAVAPDATA